jgi:hypothetical protein
LPLVIPYFACFVATNNFYQLPGQLLPSIYMVERGDKGVLHQNTDGTVDMGVMQINTRWVGPITTTLGRVGYHWSKASVAEHLIYDPCFNIAAAGLILRTYWVLGGHDWRRAVGDYHSHTPQLHQDYLIKVTAAAGRLFGPR